MDKINLLNDYSSIAHPNVLDAIREAGERRFPCYGNDEETSAAADTVRHLIGRTVADVHFLVGGTQANMTAVAAFLRPHEAVISPQSAHINIHETGAIESVGHKILTVPAEKGKIDAEDVIAVVKAHTDEHMVKPKMIMISQASELGTVYTQKELFALRDVCDKYRLYLYIDGARLGPALASEACDIELSELANLADAFYIGGTKNGLLFGEALVICNPELGADFRFHIKQRGALLAKGFLLGIQFRTILEDGLFFELARRANSLAARLADGLKATDIPLLADAESNQVFACVDDETLSRLEEHVLFEHWGCKREEGTPIRFVTSWQTTEAEIDAILKML